MGFKKFFSWETYAEKHIQTLSIARKLHQKEQEIYMETQKFVDKNSDFNMEYLFYDFQILHEFIVKFHTELGIVYDEEDFNSAIDVLSLAFRFLQIGYYNSVGIYLRKFFELWIEAFSDLAKRSPVKNRIHGLLNKSKVYDPPLYLEENEVYKIYQYLSDKYVHQKIEIQELKFIEKDFKELLWLFTIVIIVMSNLVVNLISEELLIKYWKNKIEKQADDYDFYAAYIGPLVGKTCFLWCHSWFQEALNYTWLQQYLFKNKEKGLNLAVWLQESIKA